MGTAFNPAKTSLASWDAFADVDAFVDAVLAELAAMAADGTRRTRSGPKPPLTGAALRKWRSGALSNRAPTVKPFLAKPLYAMAAVARTGRG
jgi:hypothetical protein